MKNAAASSSRYSLLTVAQLVISISGALLSLLAACLLIYISFHNLPQTGSAALPLTVDPFSYWILGLVILLSTASSVVALRKLRSIQPSEVPEKGLRLEILLLSLWIALLALATYLVEHRLASFLIPPIDLLLVILPLFAILAYALRKAQSGVVQHFWGLFTGSIFVSLPLILFVEIAIVASGFVLLVANFVGNPQLRLSISALSQLELTSQAQLDQLLTQLAPFLTSPLMIYGVIFGFCLLIPVIEEFLKPLMLWAFARRSLTPAQGFGMGLICGAAFALFESAFAVGSVNQQDLLQIVISRTGTSMLHTLNSGMLGWAIVSTWRDGKASRVALTYTGVVLMHGLWNFFAIISAYAALPVNLPPEFATLASASSWLLGLLFVWMITILWFMKNRVLTPAPPQLPPLNAGTGGAAELP